MATCDYCGCEFDEDTKTDRQHYYNDPKFCCVGCHLHWLNDKRKAEANKR